MIVDVYIFSEHLSNTVKSIRDTDTCSLTAKSHLERLESLYTIIECV